MINCSSSFEITHGSTHYMTIPQVQVFSLGRELQSAEGAIVMYTKMFGNSLLRNRIFQETGGDGPCHRKNSMLRVQRALTV